MITFERLNFLAKAAALDREPEGLTAEEAAAYAEIRAEIDASPDVSFSPANE
jgi:hypothetical protein